MSPEAQNILALITTVTIEFIVIWLFYKKKPLAVALYVLLINCITVPTATYIYHYILSNYLYAEIHKFLIINTLITFLLIEIIVFFTESILINKIFKVSYKKALIYSASANGITAAISLLFFI